MVASYVRFALVAAAWPVGAQPDDDGELLRTRSWNVGEVDQADDNYQVLPNGVKGNNLIQSAAQSGTRFAEVSEDAETHTTEAGLLNELLATIQQEREDAKADRLRMERALEEAVNQAEADRKQARADLHDLEQRLLGRLDSKTLSVSAGKKPPPPCTANAVIFHFEHAKLADNNLGGEGPGQGRYMRFNNVGILPSGDPFDMTVETLNSDYATSNPFLNGLRGKSGQVNVRNEKKAQLKFTMVNSGTDDPVTLPAFYFSVYDIDQNGYMSEELLVSGYDEINIPDDAEYAVRDTYNGKSLSSLKFGRICDNPKEPTNLHVINCYGDEEVDQRKRAVTMLFTNTASFEMTFKVHLTRDITTNHGRQLMFGGPTNLIEPCNEGSQVVPEEQQAVPEPTTTTTTHGCIPDVAHFDFENAQVTHNNLGGVGPDDGEEHIMYENMGTLNGNPFNLKVVVHNSDYLAGKPFKSGLTGKSGQINVKVDSQANMTFSFIDATGGQPVILPAFYITIFDLDWGPAAEEMVMVKGYEEIVIPEDHEYSVNQGPAADGKTFTATMPGHGCDNPTDPKNLNVIKCMGRTVDTRKRSFSMLFKHRSSFDVTFAAPGKENTTPWPTAGRSMQFAGISALSDECP